MTTSARSAISAQHADEALLRVCRDVIHPLVQADGGEIHLVSLVEGEIALHLSGACAGCPGVELTSRRVIEPALRAIEPNLRIKITAGASIPAGSTKLSEGA